MYDVEPFTEWFLERLAEAKSASSASKVPEYRDGIGADEAVEWIHGLPRCEKGLCREPASRYATYYSRYASDYRGPSARAVCHIPSCARHGADPVTPFPHAAGLEAALKKVRGAVADALAGDHQ